MALLQASKATILRLSASLDLSGSPTIWDREVTKAFMSSSLKRSMEGTVLTSTVRGEKRVKSKPASFSHGAQLIRLSALLGVTST